MPKEEGITGRLEGSNVDSLFAIAGPFEELGRKAMGSRLLGLQEILAQDCMLII